MLAMAERAGQGANYVRHKKWEDYNLIDGISGTSRQLVLPASMPLRGY